MGENALCIAACHSLGDTWSLLFAIVAFAWGAMQRWKKARAERERDAANAEKSAVQHQLATSLRPVVLSMPDLQALSLRPPPLPDEARQRGPDMPPTE